MTSFKLPPKFGFEGKTFKNVKIFDIVDGDTLKCTIDFGSETVFGKEVWISVRLCEIDAPEIKGETACEKICAIVSLLTLAEIICGSETHFLKKYKDEISILCGISTSKLRSEEDISKHKDQIVLINKKFKECVSDFLRSNFSSLPCFTLETRGMDLYGRVIGMIYFGGVDDTSLNHVLCKKGVVRYYKGNKCRERWCLEELYKIIQAL